jgi:hypothetical protein
MDTHGQHQQDDRRHHQRDQGAADRGGLTVPASRWAAGGGVDVCVAGDVMTMIVG